MGKNRKMLLINISCFQQALPKKTASFDTESIQVISNTKEAQVVYLPKEKRVFIAVFSSLDVKLPFGVKFNCQQLGLFVFKYK